MLAYAAHARPTGRRNSPTLLVLILGGHALLLGLVIQDKMQVARHDPGVIKIFDPLDPPPPPPNPDPAQPKHPVTNPYTPPSPLPLPTPNDPIVTTLTPGPAIIDPVPGTGPVVTPYVPPQPLAVPVRKPAVLLTSGDDLTPPYPESRRDRGEEAVLRLLLDIDARGRVIAVTPSGPADPAFLEAGRRFIIANWRYRPASADGKAVASRATITLRFQLEE